MIVTINKKKVDVSDPLCKKRSCFRLGVDRGQFVQGRGYVSYHKEQRWVCMTRYLHGCPEIGVCLNCRTCFYELQTHCDSCGIELKKK